LDAKEVERKIEELRVRLNEAVGRVQGNLQSPEVYELSRQLDSLINEFNATKNFVRKGKFL
jgi:hypothetical protein